MTIRCAEYTASTLQLRVEATDKSASAVLTVYANSTDQLIGTLTAQGGGYYTGSFALRWGPKSITVRSSRGGTTTSRTVVLR